MLRDMLKGLNVTKDVYTVFIDTSALVLQRNPCIVSDDAIGKVLRSITDVTQSQPEAAQTLKKCINLLWNFYAWAAPMKSVDRELEFGKRRHENRNR